MPIDARKINYAYKKSYPKHLEMVKSQPKLETSPEDEAKCN